MVRTKDITIEKKEIAPGVFTTGGIATIPIGSAADINTIAGTVNVQPNIAIDADIIGNTPLPRIPPVPPIPKTTSLLGITASLGAGKDGIIPPPEPIVTDVAPPTTITPPTKTITETVQELLGLRKAPPSIAEAFVDIFGQPITAAELQQKEQKVMSLTNQLNAITAQSTADILALDKKITGAGITDIRSSFLDKQKVEISRNAAIQALPLAAQLSAAQNDFSTAQGHLNSYFNLVVQDIQAQNDFFNNSVDLAFDLFSRAEQNRLNEIKTQKATDVASMRNAVRRANDLANIALQNGDMGSVQTLTALTASPPNPNSATFEQDLTDFINNIASITGSITLRTERTDTKFEGFTGSEVNQIKKDIAEFGLDKTLEGVTDPKQVKDIISLSKGKETTIVPKTIEEFITIFTEVARGRKALGFTRKEFESELKAEYGDDIPDAIKEAIEGVGTEIWGRTILEKILPFGR